MEEFDFRNEQIVPHPFDQARAEVADAYKRINEEHVANEAGVNDMQSMLNNLHDPELDALRDARDHVNQFDVPKADAEVQAEFILANEASRIMIAAALRRVVEALRKNQPKRAGRQDISGGYASMSKLIESYRSGKPADSEDIDNALKNVDQQTIIRSKPQAVQSFSQRLSAATRAAMEQYGAPRQDLNDPNNPRNV